MNKPLLKSDNFLLHKPIYVEFISNAHMLHEGKPALAISYNPFTTVELSEREIIFLGSTLGYNHGDKLNASYYIKQSKNKIDKQYSVIHVDCLDKDYIFRESDHAMLRTTFLNTPEEIKKLADIYKYDDSQIKQVINNEND